MIAGATFWKKWHAPFHGPLDELLKCPKCKGYVAGEHSYCKHCGHEFGELEKMEMAVTDRHNKFTGPKIGMVFFLLALVVFAIGFGALL